MHRGCPTRAIAEHLAAAVAADNPPFVLVSVEGTELAIRLTSPSASSARATLDDLLACLQVAERSLPDTGGSPVPVRESLRPK